MWTLCLGNCIDTVFYCCPVSASLVNWIPITVDFVSDNLFIGLETFIDGVHKVVRPSSGGSSLPGTLYETSTLCIWTMRVYREIVEQSIKGKFHLLCNIIIKFWVNCVKRGTSILQSVTVEASKLIRHKNKWTGSYVHRARQPWTETGHCFWICSTLHAVVVVIDCNFKICQCSERNRSFLQYYLCCSTLTSNYFESSRAYKRVVCVYCSNAWCNRTISVMDVSSLDSGIYSMWIYFSEYAWAFY